MAVAVALIAGSSSCAGAAEQPTITVLAGASLTEPFEELGERFSAEHRGVRVRFDFQGSSILAEQLRQGRPADVFASADQDNMRKAVDSGVAEGAPAVFATNRLTIAVQPGNPHGIDSLADLNAPGRVVVSCAEPVPCGDATARATEAAGVELRPVSEENDVKAVLRKVVAGEADAGLVYVTDARAAKGQVTAVDFPTSREALNSYPITKIDSTEHPRLADEFTDYVRGPVGREVLGRAGFEAP
ncbi:molybdate ABC transporter substrate-binding protein [Parasphingorhabdus pacifica]